MIVLCYNLSVFQQGENVNFRKKVLVVILVLLDVSSVKSADRIMILDAQKKLNVAKANQVKVEELFKANTEASALKKSLGVTLEIKKLQDYFVVTLSPINSVSAENRLNMLLRPKFPDTFVVAQWKDFEKQVAKPSVKPKRVKKRIKADNRQWKEKTNNITDFGEYLKKNLIQGINNKWLILIILAVLGLLFGVRSIYQIKKIKGLQKTLEETQRDHGYYLDTMEKRYE